MHAGSWRATASGFLSWDELADRLIPYVADMNFTHIEFMPISEHPYDPSWGYQTTGLYAPTARFGPPEGFARFVDGAHRAGIGVILDWVPAHFPTDEHGLARFDGTALYEHADPRQGFHPDWNTAIYNFGRQEVFSFLINNALYWTEKFHVDGLRVDAVASMLYLDYSRREGEWIPNKYGGRENLEAVAFLQAMNRAVYGKHPGRVTFAEEFDLLAQGLARPVYDGGLGFGFKWNMGWMHDTLQYMAREPVYRKYHHNDLTFGLLYAFTENFVLPLSHDEVVHGKGSLLDQDARRRLAEIRQPARLLRLHVGLSRARSCCSWARSSRRGRSGPRSAGSTGGSSTSSRTRGCRRWSRDLNRLYRDTPALHQRDCEGDGFSWLIADDRQNSVFAWLRKAPGQPPVAVISNFTPVPRTGYGVPLPQAGRWKEIMNSDAGVYGGSGMGNMGGVRRRGTRRQHHRHSDDAAARDDLAGTRSELKGPPGPGTTGEGELEKRTSPLARDAMAYVLAGGRGSRLKELTDRRAKPAVYFGGKVRIIDFALSNALNSGIRRIGVATQYKAHSPDPPPAARLELLPPGAQRELRHPAGVAARLARPSGTKAPPTRSTRTSTSSPTTSPSSWSSSRATTSTRWTTS